MKIRDFNMNILHIRNKITPAINGKAYIMLTGLRMNMARMIQE